MKLLKYLQITPVLGIVLFLFYSCRNESTVEMPMDTARVSAYDVWVQAVEDETIGNFSQLENKGYVFDLKLDQVDFEGNRYVVLGADLNMWLNNSWGMPLSRKRAEAVAKALIETGAPSSMLKYKGVGNVKPVESKEIIYGDLKVTIELTLNQVY